MVGIKKIRIVSNSISYGMPPKPEDEVKQNLTISATGRVWFTSYLYGEGYGAFKKLKTQHINIGKENAVNILSLIGKYLDSQPVVIFATDIGDWKMTITELNESEQKIVGSLCGGIVVNDIDLTNLIRSILGKDNLFVFGD